VVEVIAWRRPKLSTQYFESFKTLSKLRGAVFTEKYGVEVCKVWFDENVYFARSRKSMEFAQAQAIANHAFNNKIARPLH
jgi:hypothetical protein